MEHKKRVWFGPKQLGVGVSPVSIEGWIVTVLFVGGAIAWERLLGHRPPVGYGLMGLIAGYIAIVFMTYGKPEDQ